MRSKTWMYVLLAALTTTGSAATAPNQIAATAKALQSAVTTAPAPPAVVTLAAAVVLTQSLTNCPRCGELAGAPYHTICPQCLMAGVCLGDTVCFMCTAVNHPHLPRCYVQWVLLDPLFGDDEWVPGTPDACACTSQNGYTVNVFVTGDPFRGVLVKWVGQSHHFSNCSLGEEHDGSCNGEVVFIDLHDLPPPPPPPPPPDPPFPPFP